MKNTLRQRLPLPLPAGETASAIAPGMDRHALPGADPRHLGAGFGDLAGDLVAGDERLADQEIAVPAFKIIVQVGAADATRTDSAPARRAA